MLEYVIIGGGISGVSALEELLRLLRDETTTPVRVTLLHDGASLTRIAASVQHTERLEEVTRIADIDADAYRQQMHTTLPEHMQLRLLNGRTTALDVHTKTIQFIGGADGVAQHLRYDKVCICTGARPKTFLPASTASPPPAELLTIRDGASIRHLAQALSTPVASVDGREPRRKKICIVGNGGIAMELVYALQTSQLAAINATNAVAEATPSSGTPSPASAPLTLPPLSVHWLVAHPYLGSTFLDHMASAFLLPLLFPDADPQQMKHLATAHDSQPNGPQHAYSEEEKIVGVQHGHHARTKYTAPEGSEATAAAIGASAAASSTIATPASSSSSSSSSSIGPALGPQWLNQLHLDTNVPKYVLQRAYTSKSSSIGASSVDLKLELQCEVTELAVQPRSSSPAEADAFPLALTLSNDQRIECDLVVSATGVHPNVDWCPSELVRSSEADGGIVIDECMRTSVADVFAAGDCATLRFSAGHESAQHSDRCPNLFHSSRLWSHAKLLGCYAARALSGLYADELADLGGFNFLLFAHTTLLFGRKAILLGRYNLQGYSLAEVRRLKAEGALKTLIRCKPAGCEEFIKLHLVHGRIIGAVLLGGDETADLEETFENLMLNQTNLEQFGDFLNDVDVDLADYFD